MKLLLFIAGLVITCGIHTGRAEDTGTLRRSFVAPPLSSAPQTWWHWSGGNISKEGITADLEAMASKSAVMPSLEILPPDQCHQVCGAEDKGGATNERRSVPVSSALPVWIPQVMTRPAMNRSNFIFLVDGSLS